MGKMKHYRSKRETDELTTEVAYRQWMRGRSKSRGRNGDKNEVKTIGRVGWAISRKKM